MILVNRDSKVHTKLKNPQSGTYQNLFTPAVSGIAVPITHGWTAGDVTVSKRIGQKKVKAKFRFVNSQFESLGEPSIRAKQAQELLNGPAARKRTIILGSFYSNVPGVMAGDEQAYKTLLDGGFRERSTDKPSCCVANVFTSPPSEFDHQIDHVMTNMGRKVKLLASEVTGREQRNGIYDAPHAGIFSQAQGQVGARTHAAQSGGRQPIAHLRIRMVARNNECRISSRFSCDMAPAVSPDGVPLSMQSGTSESQL